MEATDRMGGFVSARIIETKMIDRFIITGSEAKISLKAGASFQEITTKKGGISPSVSGVKEKSGTIYQINLTISAKNPTGIKLKSFNKMIAICTNPMGVDYIFGTPSFPLTCINVPVLSDRASGEIGEMLNLDGRQPYYPLILSAQ